MALRLPTSEREESFKARARVIPVRILSGTSFRDNLVRTWAVLLASTQKYSALLFHRAIAPLLSVGHPKLP